MLLSWQIPQPFMSKKYESDRAQIARLKKGDKNVLDEVYPKSYQQIKSFVLKNKGTANDAEDIYQESIIIFFENVMKGKLDEIEASIHTYLNGIARNKWLYQLRKRNKNPEYLTDIQESEFGSTGEEEGNTPLQWDEKLYEVLAKLGNPCKDILLDFYYFRNSMEQIAQAYGYKDMNSAKSKKNKCMNRARQIALELVKTDFI